MRRINGRKHIIIDGKKQFAEGTSVTPDWFNDVQEELCNLIESELALGEDRSQLKHAIDMKISNVIKSLDTHISRIEKLEKTITKIEESISPLFVVKDRSKIYNMPRMEGMPPDKQDSFISVVEEMSGNDYMVLKYLHNLLFKKNKVDKKLVPCI